MLYILPTQEHTTQSILSQITAAIPLFVFHLLQISLISPNRACPCFAPSQRQSTSFIQQKLADCKKQKCQKLLRRNVWLWVENLASNWSYQAYPASGILAILARLPRLCKFFGAKQVEHHCKRQKRRSLWENTTIFSLHRNPKWLANHDKIRQE